MDTGRLLTTAAALTLMSGCAVFKPALPDVPIAIRTEDIPDLAQETAGEGATTVAVIAESEIEPPDDVDEVASPVAIVAPVAAPVLLTGRRAIAAANTAARTSSVSDGFVGGVQVFAWSPGRVFEVWTAPLRVTTLTLGPGETLVTKVAGDTVRWQIGEAVSGEGTSRRVHVVLKPLERGLETNLVLTTNRRVYLIDLRSGAADAFNTAVAWDDPDVGLASPATLQETDVVEPEPSPLVAPQGPLDGRYRIEPRGRRPRWTPTSVFNDGRRTFITFDADMQVDEAPALFVLSPQGEAQMVNYRQVGGLFVVDRLFDQAELRLGDRRPQVVRLRRLSGDRR